MIRLSTFLWLAVAAAIGFGLFHLKYEVQALEDELFRLNRAILGEQQATHVLKAEWSYMNQPQRLQALANRHLELRPMKPDQLGRMTDVPRRSPTDGQREAAATTSQQIAPTPAKPVPPRPARVSPDPAAPAFRVAPMPPSTDGELAAPSLAVHTAPASVARETR